MEVFNVKDYPVVSANGHLADNDIWTIPLAPTNEVRGCLKTQGPWTLPVSYRALAMDSHGRVFGLRTMFACRESGYVLEGRVKVEGKSYRAFTSSKLFARRDGSLCDVATVHVCGTPDKQWKDPLTVDSTLYRAYLNDLASRYHYEREGTYADLCRYATCLDRIASGWAAECPWCETEKEAAELRQSLTLKMGW